MPQADLQAIIERFRAEKLQAGDAKQAQVEFIPGEPTAASLGQRILVLDEGMLLSSTTRYRKRVLAHITQNADGQYVEYRPTVTVPAALAEFFARLDAYPQFLSAAELQPLQAPFLEAFSSEIASEYWAGHGNPIFHMLVEANPDAQFVVGQHDLRQLWDVADFCRLLSPDEAQRDAVLAALQLRYENAKSSLAALTRKFSISYVNASWGADYATTTANLASICGSTPDATVVNRLMELDHGLIKSLAGLHNGGDSRALRDEVILVQAGISAYGRMLQANDADFPIDCDGTIANRWRVASFFNAAEDIGADGTSDRGYLSSANLNTIRCVDAYINVGYGVGVFGERPERARQLRDTPFGIGWGPQAWPPTSSFVAPVGLSYLIFLQEQSGARLSASDLLSTATHGGALPILDPIQNQQFRAEVMGYPWF